MKYKGKDAIDFSHGYKDERNQIKTRLMNEAEEIWLRRKIANSSKNTLAEICAIMRRYQHLLKTDLAPELEPARGLWLRELASTTLEDITKAIKEAEIDSAELTVE